MRGCGNPSCEHCNNTEAREVDLLLTITGTQAAGKTVLLDTVCNALVRAGYAVTRSDTGVTVVDHLRLTKNLSDTGKQRKVLVETVYVV